MTEHQQHLNSWHERGKHISASFRQLLVAKPVEPSLYITSKYRRRDCREASTSSQPIAVKELSSEIQRLTVGQNILDLRSWDKLKQNTPPQKSDASNPELISYNGSDEAELQKYDFTVLSDSPLFSDWSKDKLQVLQASLDRQYHRYGSVIVREGHPVFHIFFLLSGEVSIARRVLCEVSSKASVGSEQNHRATRNRASEVRLATATSRGAVFGDAAALLRHPALESVRVESRAGAMVLRLNVADLQQLADPAALARLRQFVRDRRAATVGWRASQAMRQAEVAAAATAAPDAPVFIDFPTRQELAVISRRLNEDLCRPLAARRCPPPRPGSAQPAGGGWPSRASFIVASPPSRQRPQSAAGRLNDSGRDALWATRPSEGGSRPASALSGRRPSSALSGGRGPSRPASAQPDRGLLGTAAREGVRLGGRDVTRRRLFLDSWTGPGEHRVYLGSKVPRPDVSPPARSDSDAQVGPAGSRPAAGRADPARAHIDAPDRPCGAVFALVLTLSARWCPCPCVPDPGPRLGWTARVPADCRLPRPPPAPSSPCPIAPAAAGTRSCPPNTLSTRRKPADEMCAGRSPPFPVFTVRLHLGPRFMRPFPAARPATSDPAARGVDSV